MILVLDTNGKIARINRKGEEILGWSNDTLVDKNWFTTCLPKHIRKSTQEIFNSIIAGKLKLYENVESVVVTIDGEERVIYWHNTILKDSERNIIGTLSSGNDITESKRAKEALQESEAQLSNILSSSAVGIAYVDNRQIKWANEAMTKMLGYEDEKDYIGKYTRIPYATDEEYDRVGKIIYTKLKAGKDGFVDAKFIRKDVSTFDGHITINAPDPSKPMSGTIVDIMDITDRKRAEEALRESEIKPREAQQIAHIGS